MKSPITIDFVNSIIIVNAAYAKKASNPFSQEYEQLQRVRADYRNSFFQKVVCNRNL